MRNRTRIAVIALVAMLGVGAAGLAWAWFNETTAATASGGSNANMVALDAGAASYTTDTADNKLWPNHFATVKIPLGNTNPVPVELISVTVNPTGTTGSCAADLEQNASSLSMLDDAGNAISGFVIPANKTYTLVITNGVKLKATADTACQATSFTTGWDIKAENR